MDRMVTKGLLEITRIFTVKKIPHGANTSLCGTSRGAVRWVKYEPWRTDLRFEVQEHRTRKKRIMRYLSALSVNYSLLKTGSEKGFGAEKGKAIGQVALW